MLLCQIFEKIYSLGYSTFKTDFSYQETFISPPSLLTFDSHETLTVKLIRSTHKRDTSSDCNIYSTVCERKNTQTKQLVFLPLNEIYVHFS